MFEKNKLDIFNPYLPPNHNIYDHVPVVCHIDEETLLTKDGALVKILEINGQDIDPDFGNGDIRDYIRSAIDESFNSSKFQINIHTVRSRKNIVPTYRNHTEFTRKLDESWSKVNNFDKQLVNTIYISIVYQGDTAPISNISKTIRAIFFSAIKSKEKERIQKALDALNEATGLLQIKAARLYPKILKIMEDEKGFYSEPLMFYYKLIHLVDKRIEAPINDASKLLGCGIIKFEFSKLQISNDSDNQFAAIFSLKTFHELSPEILDKFCHLGINFIITENIIFCPSLEVKKTFIEASKIAEAANDSEINKLNNLDNLNQVTKEDSTAFCKRQVLFLIHSDDENFFKSKVDQAVSAFKNMGLPVVREDFFMPTLFWSSLPGNTRYLNTSRLSFGITKQSASFASIHHHLSGNFIGSKWGKPVSLVRTYAGFPFFINLHDSKGNGNTLLIGPEKTGKTTLMRFLVAQSVKLGARIVYIDLEGGTKQYIEELGGNYFNLQNPSDFKLNPFDYEKYYRKDPAIFADWLQTVIYPTSVKFPQYAEIFKTIAEKLINTTNLENKVAAIREILSHLDDTALRSGFEEFMGSELFNNYFIQNTECQLRIRDFQSVAFDFSGIVHDQKLMNSYLGVFLENISMDLDGKPTIFVMTNFSAIFEMPYFEDVFDEFLENLKTKNAILVASSVHKEKLIKNQHYLNLVRSFGTQIFLSDKNADKNFRKTYALNDDDLFRIKSYAADKRLFLFKQDNSSTVLSLNLKLIPEALKILESRNND